MAYRMLSASATYPPKRLGPFKLLQSHANMCVSLFVELNCACMHASVHQLLTYIKHFASFHLWNNFVSGTKYFARVLHTDTHTYNLSLFIRCAIRWCSAYFFTTLSLFTSCSTCIYFLLLLVLLVLLLMLFDRSQCSLSAVVNYVHFAQCARVCMCVHGHLYGRKNPTLFVYTIHMRI